MYLTKEQFDNAVIGKGLIDADTNYDQVTIVETKGTKEWRPTIMQTSKEKVKHVVEFETLIGLVRESGKAKAKKEGNKIVGYDFDWKDIPMKVKDGTLMNA